MLTTPSSFNAQRIAPSPLHTITRRCCAKSIPEADETKAPPSSSVPASPLSPGGEQPNCLSNSSSLAIAYSGS